MQKFVGEGNGRELTIPKLRYEAKERCEHIIFVSQNKLRAYVFIYPDMSFQEKLSNPVFTPQSFALSQNRRDHKLCCKNRNHVPFVDKKIGNNKIETDF